MIQMRLIIVNSVKLLAKLLRRIFKLKISVSGIIKENVKKFKD